MAIFAVVFGLVNLALSTGDGLTGPILAGYFYHTTGSYDTALTLFLVTYTLAKTLLYLA